MKHQLHPGNYLEQYAGHSPHHAAHRRNIMQLKDTQ
jgi:hypothetical protein